jgi:SAM-dependent methyltransferase
MTAEPTAPVRHPARFSDPILAAIDATIVEHLPRSGLVRAAPESALARRWRAGVRLLDPFAGTGRIHSLGYDSVGVELEPEWAALHPQTIVADARALPFPDASFDAVATSPCYGNRMADHQEAREQCRGCGGHGFVGGHRPDGDPAPGAMTCVPGRGRGLREPPRNTYRHVLGRPLAAGNTGAMQWGTAYRNTHRAAWFDAGRVLRPGGLFVLNVKDHLRKGARQHVTEWHVGVLRYGLGFEVVAHDRVETRGLGHGQNGDVRIPYESVVTLRKPRR